MNAVIIYEKSDAAKKASALLKRSSEWVDGRAQWSVKPWRADLLHWPPLAREALRDAAEAHLLVLAMSGNVALSPGLLNWLEGWARCRQVQDAALAVLGGGSGDTLAATATPELADFAQRHGLSCLLGDASPPEEESARPWKDLHKRQVAQTATLVHTLEQAPTGYYQSWGINE